MILRLDERDEQSPTETESCSPFPLLLRARSEQHEDPRLNASLQFCNSVLAENHAAAAELQEMRPYADAFCEDSPAEAFDNCMDGREQDHGKRRGIPPGSAIVNSSDGNQITLENNDEYRKSVARLVLRQQYRNPREPALHESFYHRSNAGHGCAAHNNDDAKARASAQNQVDAIREWYGTDKVISVLGEHETDTMAVAFHLPNGERIGTDECTETFGLHNPSDLFQPGFLDHRLNSPHLPSSLRELTPADMLKTPVASMFNGRKNCIPMVWLIHLSIMEHARKGEAENPIFRDDVSRLVMQRLHGAGLPPSIVGHLGYELLWGAAHSLAFQRKLETIPEETKKKYILHAETRIFYGNGSVTNDRNTAVQVRPGMGDEQRALGVAGHVLAKNSKPDPHLPLIIQANVQAEQTPKKWEQMEAILADQMTMLRTVGETFKGKNIFVLPTFSVKGECMFVPIHPTADCIPEIGKDDLYPVNCLEAMSKRNFDPKELYFRKRLLESRLRFGPYCA